MKRVVRIRSPQDCQNPFPTNETFYSRVGYHVDTAGVQHCE
jgi:hypothetical protein